MGNLRKNHAANPSEQDPARQQKRRSFLKVAAGTALGAAVVCSGGGFLASIPPEIRFPEETVGEKSTMSRKILVTYASKSGSTAEIAEKIGQTLSAQGILVDVLPAAKVTSVQDYEAVALGSAIRYGQWLPDAVKFLERNQAALQKMPTAFFTVHLMNQGADEASQKQRETYVAAAHKLITPKAEMFFAGIGDTRKLSFLEKMIFKAVKSPEGDFRDWEAITAWSEGLATTL